MEQLALVLDRPRTIQRKSQSSTIKKPTRPMHPPQQTIYVNGTGIDPPNDWLDDLFVALKRSRGPYTVENAEEYLDEESVELYNGWLVRQEASDFAQKGFEGNLHGHIIGAARLLRFGSVIPDNMECLLNDGNVIKPDLSMISWERQRLQVKEYGPNKRPTLMGSPEFVVEIRSFSDRRAQEKVKRAYYFRNGAEIIWDIDDKRQTIYVYRASSPGKMQAFTIGDEIDCEPLLPGWRRQISDLFEEKVLAEVMYKEIYDYSISKQRGRKEGELHGKQDMLIRVLRARFTQLPERIVNTIKQSHDMAQLDGWFDQALMAPTLDDLNI